MKGSSAPSPRAVTVSPRLIYSMFLGGCAVIGEGLLPLAYPVGVCLPAVTVSTGVNKQNESIT